MNRLLLGIGNMLMGDDGVGVRVAQALKAEEEFLGVAVEDGGTGGLALLDLMEPYGEILIVDAADFGGIAGAVQPVPPEMIFARRAWSGHDQGLADVLRLLDVLPQRKEVRILGVQPAKVAVGTALSAELQVAFPRILEAVRTAAASMWEKKEEEYHV